MSVQISAYIEDDVKANLESYSSAHGLKKGFMIENALNYYMQALVEIPSSFIVPSQITLDVESFQKIIELENTEPNEKLKDLLL